MSQGCGITNGFETSLGQLLAKFLRFTNSRGKKVLWNSGFRIYLFSGIWLHEWWFAYEVFFFIFSSSPALPPLFLHFKLWLLCFMLFISRLFLLRNFAKLISFHYASLIFFQQSESYFGYILWLISKTKQSLNYFILIN